MTRSLERRQRVSRHGLHRSGDPARWRDGRIDDRLPPGNRRGQGAGTEPSRQHRVVTALAVISLSSVAFPVWATSVQLPVTNVISVAGFGVGLALTITALCAGSERALRRVDLAALALAVVLLVGWSLSALYFQPGYGTDEAAFEQFAAQLLYHGHNPYGADLSGALSLYRVPVQYATYTLSGGMVSALGYPALPVLLVTCLLPITGGVQTVIVLNVVMLAVSAVVMWRLLPPTWRSLAPLATIGLPALFGYTVGGANVVVAMTFMLVVAHRWERVGAGGRLSRADVVRAVCLGLACSTQQLPWFIVPFLLVGMWLLRTGSDGPAVARRVVVRYAGIAAGVFAAVNAPFAVWGPKAWLEGIAAPLTQHAIPYGQGAVDLSLFFRIGGGHLAYYTYAGMAILAALLVSYAVWFRVLGRAAFVLPVAALFFPTRSLAEYFMTLVAVWLVSLVTVDPVAFGRAASWDWPLRVTARAAALLRIRSQKASAAAVAVALALPGSALLAAAATSPAPLRITIDDAQTNGELQGVWKLDLEVANTSADALRPHFAANYIGQATTFWNILSGPAKLAAHAAAHYVIEAPNAGSMPGIHTPFLVQAVTAKPQTVSSSTLFTPQRYATDITPGFINRVQRPGATVKLVVELRSPFGSVIHQAGVRVALGQLIYGQTSLIPAQAVINGSPEGQTPVFASTDRAGRAVFTVRVTDTQPYPLSFQAWVAPTHHYPYGYSEIVDIMWAHADAGS